VFWEATPHEFFAACEQWATVNVPGYTKREERRRKTRELREAFGG
jgi:hypothetical protein